MAGGTPAGGAPVGPGDTSESLPLAGVSPAVDLPFGKGEMGTSRRTFGWNVQCFSSSISSRVRKSRVRSARERSARGRGGELCRLLEAWPRSVSAGRKVHSASSAAAADLRRSTRRCEEGKGGKREGRLSRCKSFHRGKAERLLGDLEGKGPLQEGEQVGTG